MKLFKTVLLILLAMFVFTSCADSSLKKDANERLYRAIQNNGEITDVQAAVNNGASIDRMRRGYLIGVNMIEFAIANGRDDIALLLIDNGADVNYRSSIRGETLLMYCAKSCNYALCEALLEHGANVTTRDRVQDSALEYALRAGEDYTEREIYDVFQLLLENGAEITHATLSAALSGYSGEQNADGRYAILRVIVETLRANGETVILPEELELAVSSAAEPSSELPKFPVFFSMNTVCDCNCGCQHFG